MKFTTRLIWIWSSGKGGAELECNVYVLFIVISRCMKDYHGIGFVTCINSNFQYLDNDSLDLTRTIYIKRFF